MNQCLTRCVRPKTRINHTADNQRLEIERAGYAVEYWYADTVSGKAHAALRKQFGILLGKLRARDTLVVSKLDRLGATRQTCWRRSRDWPR